MQYEEEGYLPEALFNYLARLGWSHGDERSVLEGAARRMVRSRAHQPVAGAVQSREAAWLNAQYLKEADDARLAELAQAVSWSRTAAMSTRVLRSIEWWRLLKERVSTLKELADAAVYFYRRLHRPPSCARSTTATQLAPAAVETLLYASLRDSAWNRARASTKRSRPSLDATQAQAAEDRDAAARAWSPARRRRPRSMRRWS